MRGASGAYDVDPTDSNDFAQARDGKFLASAEKAAGIIAVSKPVTIDGLRAKANALKIAVILDSPTSELVLSLIDDLKHLHERLQVPTDTVFAIRKYARPGVFPVRIAYLKGVIRVAARTITRRPTAANA